MVTSTCTSTKHAEFDCRIAQSVKGRDAERRWRFGPARWCDACLAAHGLTRPTTQEGPRGATGTSTGTGRPARAPRPSRGPGRATAGRPCTCGCGETTGGGLFRPGHDSRLLAALVTRARAGEPVQVLAGLLPSEALRSKFASRLGVPSSV